MRARGLWSEVNNFFSSTSIHGFPYISDSQSRSTRIIWTLCVLTAFGVTSYFLYQTVDGFGSKYVSTTIETRSIQEYPFPAVTFHPGDYNSKNAFLRSFLNQFEFTRYYENSSKRNNDNFFNIYTWLVTPHQEKLFEDVEKFLIKNQGLFLQSKESIYRYEICGLLTLQMKNISIKEYIVHIFASNMYKLWRFPDLVNLVRKQISSRIQELVKQQNFTESHIASICNNKEYDIKKTNIEAMLLSYMRSPPEEPHLA